MLARYLKLTTTDWHPEHDWKSTKISFKHSYKAVQNTSK